MSAGGARPSLRDATDAALVSYARRQRPEGIRTPITQRRGLTARINALESSLGEKAAAAAAGVTLPTWRTWKRGTFKRYPTAKSLTSLQGAYERDLDSKTLRRLSSGRHKATVAITAEIQWNGYYNGQDETGPANEEFPPELGNEQAHRTLNLTGPKGDTVNIGPLYRAYLRGQDTGDVIERMANRYFSMPTKKGKLEIFPNTYYKAAFVSIRAERTTE